MHDTLLSLPSNATALSGRLCLVTGGAGFIGSHLVDALRSQGAAVRVLDNFSTGYQHNLAHTESDPNVEVVEGDASEADVVHAAMKNVEIVFHGAAMASVPRSMREPDLCHAWCTTCLLYTSPSPRDQRGSRMPSSA